ncbi:MAG TPA: hypothetical protein DDZ80_16435 [Cyanobacteria bacterium UBA8803]|nr:hypothetical protein [Cyanobacteria bacterium UBA9273]HBL59999.1 hypothetical protein [Cyanobacteria bacterium UBA8803]
MRGHKHYQARSLPTTNNIDKDKGQILLNSALILGFLLTLGFRLWALDARLIGIIHKQKRSITKSAMNQENVCLATPIYRTPYLTDVTA